MKNKKGFTLVELLGVIVVLAIITAIAVGSINKVIRTSNMNAMKDTAEHLLDGVRVGLLSVGELNATNKEGYYYFTDSLNDQGGKDSPMGGSYLYIDREAALADTNYTKIGEKGIFRYDGEKAPVCTDSKPSFVRIKRSGSGTYNYSICLTAGEGNYHITSAIDENTSLPFSIENRLLDINDFEMIVRVNHYDSDAYADVVNVMDAFPSTITSRKNNISKVLFWGDFQENIDKEYNAASIKADLSNGTGTIKAWLVSDEDRSDKYILYIKSQGYTYLTTMASLFNGWQYVDTFDFQNARATNVTNASSCFAKAGYYAPSFNIYNLDKLDTSNVTNMSSMFDNAAHNVSRIDMVLNFDTSSVTSMYNMLLYFGYQASYFRADISNWDVSNVTSTSGMFNGCGADASSWTIGDLKNWNTSSLVGMGGMFNSTNFSGSGAWNVGDISHWNTSNVTDMSYAFFWCEGGGTLNISGWDTSNVTNMEGMFRVSKFTKIYVGDGWDMSKVTNTTDMFRSSSVVGEKGTRVSLLDGTYARIDGKGGPGYFSNGDPGPYKVNVTSSKSSWGTVTGSGIYAKGSPVTLTATPIGSYGFVGWYIGDLLISDSSTYTWNAEYGVNIVGRFDVGAEVKVVSDNLSMGNVSGGGVTVAGRNVTVKATTNNGYAFDGWYNGNILVSTFRTYTFVVEDDITLTARFKPYIGPTWTYQTADSASYGFELKSDGYFESTNKGINSSASVGVITIYNPNDICSIDIHVINYAESSYDYGIIGKLDSTLSNSNAVDSSIKWSGSGKQSASEQIITFDNVSKGEHKIYIKYRKDGSVNSGNDSLKFKVGFEGDEPIPNN